MRCFCGKLPRRSFLGLGIAAGLPLQGLSAASVPRRGRAKQVLIVFEQGGMSQMDTWDPKPEAIAEHRSPFKPIDTNVPGMQFTDLLAHTARQADKLAVVRSMHHRVSVSGHPDGTQYLLSGARPGGPILMPDVGSVVAKLVGSPCGYLPPYIMAPGNGEQSYNTSQGFLSPGYKIGPTRPMTTPRGSTSFWALIAPSRFSLPTIGRSTWRRKASSWRS
jgi:hypothetical protein